MSLPWRLLPLLPVVLLAPAGHAQAPATTEATADATAPSPLRPVERTFLQGAVAAARQTREYSRLAAAQASDAAVRDLAEQVASDYSEIDRSLEALARRKDAPPPLEPTSFSDAYRALASEPPANFDRAYLLRLAASTRRELRLCETVLADGRDADLRELAGSLLPTLRAHQSRIIALQKQL